MLRLAFQPCPSTLSPTARSSPRWLLHAKLAQAFHGHPEMGAMRSAFVRFSRERRDVHASHGPEAQHRFMSLREPNIFDPFEASKLAQECSLAPRKRTNAKRTRASWPHQRRGSPPRAPHSITPSKHSAPRREERAPKV